MVSFTDCDMFHLRCVAEPFVWGYGRESDGLDSCEVLYAEHIDKFCLKLDYLGIVFSTVATGVSFVYFAFPMCIR